MSNDFERLLYKIEDHLREIKNTLLIILIILGFFFFKFVL